MKFVHYHTLADFNSEPELLRIGRNFSHMTGRKISDGIESYIRSTYQWRCSHCKQRHAEKRDECKVCGREDFVLVESDDGQNYEPPPDDVVTVSNVSEVTTKTSGTGGTWIVFIGLLIFGLLVVTGLWIL